MEEDTNATARHDAALMRRGADQITQLRGQVAALAPQAQAYQAILQILGLMPRAGFGTAGYEEDMAYRLEARSNFIVQEIAAAETKAKEADEIVASFLRDRPVPMDPVPESAAHLPPGVHLYGIRAEAPSNGPIGGTPPQQGMSGSYVMPGQEPDPVTPLPDHNV